MILSRPFIDHIELSYLKLTSILLKKNKINPKTAKKSAGDFLHDISFDSFADFEKKLHSFIEKYPWLDELQSKVAEFNDNDEKKTLLTKIHSFIK
jgi:hypothetical protein